MEPTDDKGSITVSQLALLSLAAISKTESSPQNSIAVLETDVAVINATDSIKKIRIFANTVNKSDMPSKTDYEHANTFVVQQS